MPTRRWKSGFSFHSSAKSVEQCSYCPCTAQLWDVPSTAGSHIVTSRSRLRCGSFNTTVPVPTGLAAIGLGEIKSCLLCIPKTWEGAAEEAESARKQERPKMQLRCVAQLLLRTATMAPLSGAASGMNS